MNDLRQALDQISVIRAQLARGTQFRGYGPLSTAATGALAIAVALGQSWWFYNRPPEPDEFLFTWIATAALGAALCCWEAVQRSHLFHYGLSREMVQTAIEQFVPAAVTGLLLTVVITRAAPHETWMLPGLWAITFGMGVFASRQFLPRHLFWVALWYLVAGLGCITLQAGTHELSPWSMGIPFGIGQLLLAAVLHHGDGNTLEKGNS